MKRKLYNKLILWKDDPMRKPLLLSGAHHVGKTFLVEQFSSEFENVARIDFQSPVASSIKSFDRGYSALEVLRDLSAISSSPIIPGKTLLFLDGIQDMPCVLQYFKDFCEQTPEYHIIGALSITGHTVCSSKSRIVSCSFPVGKVDMLTLYPLDFEEFLWALGRESLVNILREGNSERIVNFTNYLERAFRYYLFVGGMPEAVSAFVANATDIAKVRATQHNILKGYEKDFQKYSSPQTAMKMQQIWAQIPMALNSDTKKIVYGKLKRGARGRDYADPVARLKFMGLINKIDCCDTAQVPLSAYSDNSNFKLYPLDCGLLGAMGNVPSSAYVLSDGNKAMQFKGAITETYVLQQILASEYESGVFFYKKENPSSEIDFLIEPFGEVIPIEVKSERHVTSLSFRKFLERHPGMKGIRTSMRSDGAGDGFVSIPLYQIGSYISSIVEEKGREESEIIARDLRDNPL